MPLVGRRIAGGSRPLRLFEFESEARLVQRERRRAQAADPHGRPVERRSAGDAGHAAGARVRRPRDVLRRGRQDAGSRRRHVHRPGLRRVGSPYELQRSGEEVRLPAGTSVEVLQQVGPGAFLQFLAAVGRDRRAGTPHHADRPLRAEGRQSRRFQALEARSAGRARPAGPERHGGAD